MFMSAVYVKDEIFDMLLELYNKIKDKFKFINENTEVYVIDDSLSSMDFLLDSLDKLADMLEINPLFEREYRLCLNIISYMEFINQEDLLKESLYFIGNTVINFCNLIYDKLEFILSDNLDDYEEEYQNFLIFFNNQEEYFNTYIIPDYENEYDELIKDVANVLW